MSDIERYNQEQASDYTHRQLINTMHGKVQLLINAEAAELCRKALTAYATAECVKTENDIHDLALLQQMLRLAERLRSHTLKPNPTKKRAISLSYSEASAIVQLLEVVPVSPEHHYEFVIFINILSQIDKK